MEENEELNLNEQYKKLVEDVQGDVPNEAEDAKDLGKVDMDRFATQKAQDSNFHLGYHQIPIGSLPSSGMFYPVGTQIHIRAAKVAEIRNYSTIDETNILDVDDKLNAIVESCTKVSCDKKVLSYKDLCEEDRFYLILSIY